MPYPTHLTVALNNAFQLDSSGDVPFISRDDGFCHFLKDESNPNRAYTQTPSASSSSSSSLDTIDDSESDPILAPRAKYSPGHKFPEVMPLNVMELIDQENPSSPVSDLNPNANSFVPRGVLAWELAPSGASASGEAMPSWVPYFEIGARASLDNNMEMSASALAIVSTCYWSMKEIAVLVRHIIWMACDVKSGKPHDCLAQFAVEINKKFYAIHGPDAANAFVWYLRECATGSFKECWDPNSPKSISYELGPTQSYVESAISLTSFIGELLPYRLVQAPFVFSCLSILVDALSCHEHVYAIEALLEAEASSFFQKPGDAGFSKQAMEALQTKLAQNVAALNYNSSVLLNHLKPGEIQKRVVKILEILREPVNEDRESTVTALGSMGSNPPISLQVTPKQKHFGKKVKFGSLSLSPI